MPGSAAAQRLQHKETAKSGVRECRGCHHIPGFGRSGGGTRPWITSQHSLGCAAPHGARAHGIVQACLSRRILILGDRAYQGAGAAVRTPTAATATCPSTTSHSTGTTHVSVLPVNAPSHA